MNRTVRILALLLCLVAAPARAQTVDIPIEDARIIATRAALAGEWELAEQIARALLARNPDDRAALIVLAAAAPRLNNPAEGRRAGVRAWQVSETDAQKYEAARLVALAAAAEERFTLSTFWLRRALTVAPNDEERARTIQDGRRVSQLNPWSTNLIFSIVPSTNVNGGAAEDDPSESITLSRDALALAGVRATLGFSTRYRFNTTATSRSTIGLRYQISRVALEDDGEPTTENGTDLIRNEDYATDYLAFSFDHVQALENGNVGINLTIGTYDYGLEPYYDFKRVGLTRTLPLTDSTTLQLSASRELQDYESTAIDEVRRTILGTALSYRLENGDRITGSLSHLSSDSPNDNSTFDEWSVIGSYSWADPFGPVSLSVNAGVKRAEYPVYRVLFDEDEREDRTFLYGANIGFPGIEYAGFSPLVTISGSVAESNFSRFTRDSFSVGLVLNSAF